MILALVGGCRAEMPSAPTKLVDGSPALRPRVVLEGAEGPSVTTVVRVIPADAAASTSDAASCIAAMGEAPTALVERVGVKGRSITVLGRGQRTAHACDASTAGDSGDGWCGYAFAQVESGRLRDPRLSLTCRGTDGDPVGFAWIQPSAEAQYTVVQEAGYAEVYTRTGDVPMRITTAVVDVESSRAVFSISEHAKSGRRLRSYELEAQVAG